MGPTGGAYQASAKATRKSTRRARARKVRSALGYGLPWFRPSRVRAVKSPPLPRRSRPRRGTLPLHEEQIPQRRPVRPLARDEVERLEAPPLARPPVERVLERLLGDRRDLHHLVGGGLGDGPGPGGASAHERLPVSS